jgi:hypothetical protein
MEKYSLTTNEIEFFSEDEVIEIIPKFELDEIELIQVKHKNKKKGNNRTF